MTSRQGTIALGVSLVAILVVVIAFATRGGAPVADDSSVDATDTVEAPSETPSETAGTTEADPAVGTTSSRNEVDGGGVDEPAGDGGDVGDHPYDGSMVEPVGDVDLGTARCGIELYTVTIPAGWYADAGCARFSRQPVAEGVELTEVDIAWTYAEGLDAAVSRIVTTPDTWRVLDDAARVVNDRRAHWFAVELGPDAGREGEQEIIAIEMAGGTLFLAASSWAPDGVQPVDFGSNVDALETIAATIEVIDFVDCEMTSPPVARGTQPVGLDLDGDGITEFIGVSLLDGNNAAIDVWRWTCDEEFVSMLQFREQGTRQAPAFSRCRVNGDGTVDVVFYNGWLDGADDTHDMFATVYRKVGNEMRVIEAYEQVDVVVEDVNEIEGFPATVACEDVSPR